MSALSDKAMAIAQAELAAGVRGGPPWAKFRGTRVDEYQRAVGLPLSPNMHEQGFPWCASAVYWCFQQAWHDWAATASTTWPENPCPRTAGALKMWDAAQDAHGTHSPAPGCVFVLDRGNGHGHVGFVEQVNADGTITTCEPDTSNHELSATGDAWGRHVWDPAAGVRGTLLGYLQF